MSKRHRNFGFTLMELVIAVAAGGIVAFSASMLLLECSTVLSSATRRVVLADSIARAMEQMTRTIREIAQDAGLTGQAQISTASATDLRFGANGFRQNGSVIEMTIDTATSWHRACANVSALTLRYYDRNGNELASVPLSGTDRTAVRQVSIELQASSLGQTHRVRTRVYLRNFMNECS